MEELRFETKRRKGTRLNIASDLIYSSGWLTADSIGEWVPCRSWSVECGVFVVLPFTCEIERKKEKKNEWISVGIASSYIIFETWNEREQQMCHKQLNTYLQFAFSSTGSQASPKFTFYLNEPQTQKWNISQPASQSARRLQETSLITYNGE